jgi:hypothetical protein
LIRHNNQSISATANGKLSMNDDGDGASAVDEAKVTV